MPDNAIWAVTGPEHDARMAREVAWLATGGQTGIVGPASCEVRAQPTPGNTVRIMPGGFAIAATSPSAAIGYTSAPWQSYMRAIYEPLTVEIQPTGSSGARTDVVGIIIDDPEFEGTSPDVDSHQYWRPHVVQGTGNNATRPEHFASLGRPFLPLAQIQVPASTATITNAMIRDIRFMAIAREQSQTFLSPVSETRYLNPASNSNWTDLEQLSTVSIPQWATHMKIEGEIMGALNTSGNVRGEIDVRFAAGVGAKYSAKTPWSSDGDNWQRLEMPVVGRMDLEAAERGGSGFFRFRIRITGGSGSLKLTEEVAHYRLRVTFEETPLVELT